MLKTLRNFGKTRHQPVHCPITITTTATTTSTTNKPQKKDSSKRTTTTMTEASRVKQPSNTSATTQLLDDVAVAAEEPVVPTTLTKDDDNATNNDNAPPARIVIAGGGIVGLITALAFEKHCHVVPEVYEQSHGYDPDVGAGMGLYANGLRVIRDIDVHLLQDIQTAGYAYRYRQWERHDGTCVAMAEEGVLGEEAAAEAEEDEKKQNHHNSHHDATTTTPAAKQQQQTLLRTMGIRRWKLQQALHKAAAKVGIPIYFNKKVHTVTNPENGLTEIEFTDGSKRQTQLLIGADGGRSTIRSTLVQREFNNNDNDTTKNGGSSSSSDGVVVPTLNYTGVTCIMGVAENMTDRQGISFPVSNTTQCHGCFYPTGANEQCFQFHFPIPAKKGDSADCQDSCWGNLSQQVSRQECGNLAQILEADGWDSDQYLAPLRNVTKAVRVGFCQLTPALKQWSFPNAHGRPGTVLVGDAAHPPVPYLGQGAQQGMEDAGTLALLLKKFCLDDQGKLDWEHLPHAIKLYESIRIPRVTEILDNCHLMGNIQKKRAQNPAYNIIKEEMFQRDVFFHETLPIMFPGARYDYRLELEKVLKQQLKEHKGPPMHTIIEA